MNDLLSKAYKKYQSEGFIQLLKGMSRFVGGPVHHRYNAFYHNELRERLPTRYNIVTLNGVECLIERSPLDRFVPFYEPPWPTTDEPAYEATEADAVRSYCSTGDKVVVIGGGLGVTAVLAAREIGPEGVVDVYEPSSEAYDRIQATVAHNDLEDVINIHHASVSSKTNPSFTYRSDIKRRVVAPKDLPDADVYEMDCEGAEIPILENLVVRPDILLVETHRNHSEVVSLLDDLDYEIEDVVSDGHNQWEGATHVRAKFRR
ncbi:FkbM family methyltransferase [Halorubrum sp. CSM-61]|uniref:FkbM family methyltransferase n=1 Tax=Halorubrum sp. CSM-61 TaxID=2485838 RepID=UPI000F4BB049|nr:FkbM family methyltransferase [Halorubrum sp. CSM-61]